MSIVQVVEERFNYLNTKAKVRSKLEGQNSTISERLQKKHFKKIEAYIFELKYHY